MPSKHNLFSRSNRSQVSLGIQEVNANKQSYPGDSPLPSPALPPHSAPPPDYIQSEEHRYNIPPRTDEAKSYQPAQPSRSQSQRLPSLINTNQPSIHLVRPHNSHDRASTPSSAIDDSPDRYYQQAQSSVPVRKAEPKKRRFFGLGGSSSKEPSKGSSGTSQKLGRSISVRRKEQIDPQVYVDPGNRNVPQRWSTSESTPQDDDFEEEAGGASLHHSNLEYRGPVPPEKDPLRSPAFSPSLTYEEHVYDRQSQQVVSSSSNGRYPLERRTSHQSPWEKSTHQLSKHSRSESHQTATSYHPSPSSATSTSSYPFAHKVPQEALQLYYHEQTSRPPSQQSLEPPLPPHHPRSFDSYQPGQNQAPLGVFTPSPMGPPTGQQPAMDRRSSESTQQSQSSQGRDGGAYQPYNQSVQQQGSVLASNAPPQYNAQLAPQGQNYRGNNQSSPMAAQGNSNELGRSTPPPNRSRDDLSGLDIGQLLSRHDELQDKYRKVKKYYFDKDAQVQQLQNTLAHQRLAQSRTSLDDNEYSNRFQRLDGAINNLAFNIRRDWRSIPPWLAPHVNRDAHVQPTKEMTAVGRACISRWLVDELLERYFHPSLDAAFSSQLKIIEKNLRRFAAPTPSEEERDALLARISNWRLSTLDGLQEVLVAPQAAENRTSLTESLIEKLVASLSMMLKEPSPPGLEGGVSMIVELAVGIAANLPLESRDVFVEYVSPGTILQEAHMKVETGLPPLTNPGDGPEGDAASTISKQTEDTGSIESKDSTSGHGNSSEEVVKETTMQQQQQQAVQGKKKSMFGGFMGSTASKKNSIGSGQALPGNQPTSQGQVQQQLAQPDKERVRFSTFMAVEVRGRSVLIKAPIYLRE